MGPAAPVALVLTPQLRRGACGASQPLREPCPPAPPGEGEETAGRAGWRREVMPASRGRRVSCRGRRRERGLKALRGTPAGVLGRGHSERIPAPDPAPSGRRPRPPRRPPRPRFHFISHKVCAVVWWSRRRETYPWMGFDFEKTVFSSSCRGHLPVWPSSSAHETSRQLSFSS